MYLFVGPAKVRVLVVPCNNCSTAQYLRYIEEIRSGPAEVRLLDVSISTTLVHHNPQLYPQGRIIYDFVTSDDNKESIFLHDFEPWRKTFVVLAVGPYVPLSSVSVDALRNHFPSAIVHNVVIFDTPEAELATLCPPSDHSARSVFYYSHSLTALETILCLVLANFLTALDSYTSSFENITLRSPVSITDSNTLARTISSAQKRLSSGSFKVSFSPNNPQRPDSPSTESRARHQGRQKKILASFALLAGNYASAVGHFSDAITSLRKVEDSLWLGNALEGLAVAMLLLNYVGMPIQLPSSVIPALQLKAKPSMDTPSTVPRPLSESSSKSIRTSVASPRNSSTFFRSIGPELAASLPAELIKLLAFRAIFHYSNTLSDLEDTVPDVVYIDTLIRAIKFAICIYLGGDLSPLVIDAVVRSTKLEPQVAGSPTTKREILKEIDKVFELQLVDMSVYQQCKLYSCLATMYGDLGLMRKRAFILRTFLVGLLPSLHSAGESGRDSLALTEYASLRQIFETLFHTYGVDSPTENSALAANRVATQWTTIKLLLIKLALLVGSANHDHQFVIHSCTLLLTRFAHCLSASDQQQTRDRIDAEKLRYLQRNPHSNLAVPYWDPYLVRRAKLVTNKKRDELIPFSEIAEPNSSLNLVAKDNAKSDGLIFNPYRRESMSLLKDRLVVKDDLFQLKITLQNPFGFELAIHDIELVTDESSTVLTLFSLTKVAANLTINNWTPGLPKSGPMSNSMPSLNQHPQRPVELKRNPGGFTRLAVNVPRYDELTIAPMTIQSFLVTFRPETVGKTEIQGFNITVGNCTKQRFLIVDEEKFDHQLKIKQPANDTANDRTTTKTLTLNVIPPQPMLTLSEALIVNGMLMLLEGEKHIFTVSLTNDSNFPINYLSFAFWDSTVDTSNRKLANASRTVLLPTDVYNLEWTLLRDKPFTIQNKDAFSGKVIEPHSALKIDFEVTGKRNMRELKIMLDYANKGTDRARAFVKLVSIPLQFTVLPSIEVVNFDVMAMNSSSLLDFHIRNQPDSETKALRATIGFLKNAKQEGNIADYCLLALDLRNGWKEPVAFTLNAGVDLALEGRIDPRKTMRVFVPFKRVSWKDTDLHKPIPSLRNKQFIRNNLAEEEEKTQRELFWLREAIVDSVQGTWETGSRHGVFNLRQIRLEPRMSNVLLHDRVELQHEIFTGDQALERNGLHFELKADEFYTLKTTVVNNLDHSIYGTVRHLPFSAGSASARVSGTFGWLSKSIAVSDRKILVNGVLQNHIVHPGVGPNLTHEVHTTFVVLEKGEYEWGSLLDIFGGAKVLSRDTVILVVH